MCGRFSQHSELAIMAERFQVAVPALEVAPRYNLAPSQEALVIIQNPEKQMLLMRWGLVPAWAKDHRGTPRPINARAEEAAGKPMFRQAYRQRRCLVPADGFYEWRRGPGKGKAGEPFYFRRRDGVPFAMAGLWESWHDSGGLELLTFTILTTRANELMEPVHDRMPVILLPEDEAPWLDPAQHDPQALTRLANPYPADLLEAYPVSSQVNSPTHEGRELVAQLAAQEQETQLF